MNGKHYFCLSSVFFVLNVMQTGPCWAITANELIEKCQWAESSIRDVSVEYEWNFKNSPTLEQVKSEMGNVGVAENKDGLVKHKLKAARYFDSKDANTLRSSYGWRFLSERASTLIADKGESWDNLTKESYDGHIYKKLDIGGWPTSLQHGLVSPKSWKDSIINIKTSPIGFSIFRFELDGDDTLLSTLLRQKAIKDSLRIGNAVEKVGDFNTICVEVLLQIESRKVPIRRIYFSIQHNYTPVKFEYLNPSREGGSRLSFSIEVQSLQSVGEGLWFPASGIYQDAESPMAYAFQVTGKFIVNQELKTEDFDIKFPSGTRVSDQISGREYKVGAESK